MSSDLHARIDELEQRHHRLVRGIWIAGLVSAVGLGTGFAAGSQGPDVLRASEIVIEDPNGVVRARLGGDLPDAEFDGRTVDRGSATAGLILYDRAGHERSGYVTFDSNNHVLLTLDAGAAGDHQQTAFFLADEAGHTTLRIWNGLGDHVEMRAGVDGAHFNAVEAGTLVHQVPEIREPAKTQMCTELRSYRNNVGMDELMAACRERMSEEGCTLCLAPDG